MPAKNPRLAEHLARNGKEGWTTFSPDVPFSLLYIPDRYDRAAIVAAFLPYFGVELRSHEFPDPDAAAAQARRPHAAGRAAVGGAGWHHPTLPIRGGAAVQGALIVDVFAGELGGDTGAAVRGRVPAAHAAARRRAAAAQAHDAATLVAARAQAGRHRRRRPARRAARRARARPSSTTAPAARRRSDADGELAREPTVLEVQGDQLILAP